MKPLEQLTDAVLELDEQRVLAVVRDALSEGVSSLDLVEASEAGMRAVGERYERGEYFLSGLIMAGEIFRQVLILAQPALQTELAGSASGRVLLGTVAGDIHDIGKNVVSLALRSFGFTVRDLGVDVPPGRFLEEARDFGPDVVGLSGLVSASHRSMKEVVEIFHRHEVELGRRLPVVIGGGTIDEDVARFTGADSWTIDAMDGVRICQRLARRG